MSDEKRKQTKKNKGYNKLPVKNIDLLAVNRMENEKTMKNVLLTLIFKKELYHEIFGRSNSELDCLKCYSKSST